MSTDFDEQKDRLLKDRHSRRLTDVDWLSEQKDRLLSRFVDMKMLYVNSSFNSRKFVLWLRDSFKELELNVKWNTFIVFKGRTSHVDDFLLTRVFLRVVGDFLLTRVSLRVIRRFSLITRVSLRAYLAILFCLLAYLDEQFTRDREFDRMSISLAELRTRNRAVLEAWRWSRHRHCNWKRNCAEDVVVANWRISCWRWDRHELNRRVSFYSLTMLASVKFTSFVTMKIKYNVRNRVWLEDKQIAKREYLI